MEKPRHSSTVPTRPTRKTTGSFGYFKDKETGVAGTVVPADYLNDQLDEHIAVITDPTGGNTTLDVNNNHQLLDAIKAIAIRNSGVPSGTRQLFAQATAPVGWVQDATIDDRFIRVVSSVGGGVGGTHTPITMNYVPNHTHGYSGTVDSTSVVHTHTFSDSTVTNTVANHTHGSAGLNAAAAGTHTHTYDDYGMNMPGNGDHGDGGQGGYRAGVSDPAGSHVHDITGSTDPAGTHNHTVSVSGTTSSAAIAHTHTLSGTSDTQTPGVSVNSGTWLPKYLNVIVCTKS